MNQSAYENDVNFDALVLVEVGLTLPKPLVNHCDVLLKILC